MQKPESLEKQLGTFKSAVEMKKKNQKQKLLYD